MGGLRNDGFREVLRREVAMTVCTLTQSGAGQCWGSGMLGTLEILPIVVVVAVIAVELYPVVSRRV